MAMQSEQLAVEFAVVAGQPLLLDFYRPATEKKCPLIVWVHGGAWRAGSRKSVPIRNLVNSGYAVASVDYRLSPVAKFPAQIHDIKAAIRFLRANAEAYNIDAGEITVAGASAGGHLAALVGVTNGNPMLEGTVGKHAGVSSDVQRAISFYGASNLESILPQSTPHGLSVRVPALNLLLGGQPEDHRDLARLASPVTHVDPSDPPLLLIHGDQDPQMPINQTHELHGKYREQKLPVHFEVLHGAAHGGKRFYEPKVLDGVSGWLRTGRWSED